MLTTRYGNAIRLHLHIDEPACKLLVPSLTLQLLIENAVKHNIIEKDTPLVITIEASSKTLTVRNNLQLKTLKLPSNKIGLSNIAAKYKLLKAPEIRIEETESSFAVHVPLLKPNAL